MAKDKREVVWHEHFFPPSFDHDDENASEVEGRYDALEYDDGQIAVWKAETREIVSTHASREEAEAEAKRLADEWTPTGPTGL